MFVFVDEAIAAGRSGESKGQRVVSRVVSGTHTPTSASSADNSYGPAVYRAQRPPSWPSLDPSTTGVRPLSCASGTYAPIYAPAPPSWRMREIANAEVRGLAQKGLGTFFREPWDVFLSAALRRWTRSVAFPQIRALSEVYRSGAMG